MSMRNFEHRLELTDRSSKTDAAKLQKDKYEKLLDEHYTRAKSTVWSGWYDSEMRAWLVDHGYLKSDYQAKRDEMIGLMQSKYNQATAAPYLAWPDARLRAQLRSYGIDDTKFTTRPSLLHEVRSESIAVRISSATDSSPLRPVPEQGRADPLGHPRDHQQRCRLCRREAFPGPRGQLSSSFPETS